MQIGKHSRKLVQVRKAIRHGSLTADGLLPIDFDVHFMPRIHRTVFLGWLELQILSDRPHDTAFVQIVPVLPGLTTFGIRAKLGDGIAMQTVQLPVKLPAEPPLQFRAHAEPRPGKGVHGR